MTEKCREFAKHLSSNPEIADSLKAKAVDGEDKLGIMIEFAKEQGYDMTAEDFATKADELSKDELASVAGGGACFCLVGGGGTQTESYPENSPACACVAYGQGNDMYGMPRCICPLSGTGSEWFDYSSF